MDSSPSASVSLPTRPRVLLLGAGVDDKTRLTLEEAARRHCLVLRFRLVGARFARTLRVHVVDAGGDACGGRGGRVGSGHTVEDVGECRLLPPDGLQTV